VAKMSTKPPSILIVDDNDDLRRALADLFADRGFRVRKVADGFAALAEMRSNLPDVLVSDLNMPKMSGFELLSLVRSRFPEVRVVAMSGDYPGYEVPSGVAADAFYQKIGARSEILIQIVNAVIDRDSSHLRRSNFG
jgi:CheY-like chemotaxis protein